MMKGERIMKYYCVSSAYYDNGRVKASIEEVESESMPIDTREHLKKYDLYRDYFKTLAEAEQWQEESMNA